MDSIIPDDVSYLSFLNDKNQSLLLQNNQEFLQIEDSVSLTDEPIFTEYVDGTTSLTIGGIPVYLNQSLEAIEDEQITTTTLVQNDIANALQNQTSPEFPLEIPGKGFLTSSGLFFSNEVLLQLNLQEDNTQEIESKTNSLLISNQVSNNTLIKKQNELNIINVGQNIKSNNVKILTNDLIRKPSINNNNLQVVNIQENQQNVDTTLAKKVPESYNDLIETITAHKCKNCFALFESYEQIIKHVDTKACALENEITEKQIYLCGVCDVGFENLDNLKEHMLISHKLSFMTDASSSDVKTMPSTTAEDKKVVVNKNRFKNIVIQQEAQNKKVKCLLKGCDNRFSHVDMMMRHHACHINGENKRFKCPECEKVFYAWRLCSAHLWKCHQIDLGLYSCPICNSVKTQSPHRLITHMAIHNEALPFLCATCGKRFKQYTQLLNHQYTHKDKVPILSLYTYNDPLPFLCSTCGQRFKQQTQLITHQYIHDDKRAMLNAKINCPTCNTIFSCSKSLKNHIKSVHNKFKPYVCNICGHMCARKHMLELHIRQHTGEKPYSCTICEYKTGDHNSLRRHNNRHYGTTQYSCPHCDYQAVQSIAYKNHLKKNHPSKSGFFSCLICSFDTVNEERYKSHLERHASGTNGEAIDVVTINITKQIEENDALQKNVIGDDEETQNGLFSINHIEDMTVDTGGITIPAGSELH